MTYIYIRANNKDVMRMQGKRSALKKWFAFISTMLSIYILYSARNHHHSKRRTHTVYSHSTDTGKTSGSLTYVDIRTE